MSIVSRIILVAPIQFPPALEVGVADGIGLLADGTGHGCEGGGAICPVVPLIGSVCCPGAEVIGVATGQSGQGCPQVGVLGGVGQVTLESQFALVVPPSLSPQ